MDSHIFSGTEPPTDPELSRILADLSRREPIFHRPELGTARADFEKMTVSDFWEVGASGRRYFRAEVLNELEKRYAAPDTDEWETIDFRCRKLAPDVYLLTYTLIQNKTRRTRRSTIWQRTAEGWKIVYHQGTIVQDNRNLAMPAILGSGTWLQDANFCLSAKKGHVSWRFAKPREMHCRKALTRGTILESGTRYWPICTWGG